MKLKKTSKSERLIYIIMLMWLVFGFIGIYLKSDLTQLAGYYASLTLFVATYLWGEFKRTSQSSHFLAKGPCSSREIVIYVTICLWSLFGIYGLYKNLNINNLTVYFSALTPFVGSYIIYKTTKGNDLPIFKNVSTTINTSPIAIPINTETTTVTTITTQNLSTLEKIENKVENIVSIVETKVSQSAPKTIIPDNEHY